ncbi:hypothetical protein K2P97_06235 [bacterium]|nr:hypothetical protein [bacterium]
MNLNPLAHISMMSSLLLLSACDKGGSQFSVLSESAQYQQQATFEPRKLDVLFVVDNSGSMSSSQTSLANNFPSFINYFKNRGYDFKIAVTTSDAFYGDQFVTSGCSLCNTQQARFRSGTTPRIYVIDTNTPNLESVFAQNVNVGTSGSGDERAFSSFKAALNSSYNTGFHRSSAYLSVIIVSDEEDFSHDDINLNESYSQPTLHSVTSYKTFLETFTSGKAITDFAVSTISILDATCRSALGSGRKIGTRYMQLADATGGSKNSLCSNFDTVLNNISTHIADQIKAQFFLTRTPILSSIRVISEGVVVPQDATNGWTYDSVTNSVSIHGTYVPSAGANVTINFDPESVN